LEARARVDHSTAGGLHAVERFGPGGRLLPYVAAGHHAGLPDWEADAPGQKALSLRLLKKEVLAAAKTGGVPSEILEQGFPEEKPTGRDPAFWLRMLFSCVVDADFLDTEDFFDPEKAIRRKGYPALAELLNHFKGV
jgi:CRISPR-associated endonuclease/helicase Cas3